MDIREKLEEEVEKILGGLNLLKSEKIRETLETPPDSSLGDLATNVCFSLSRKLKKSPAEIAKEIVARVKIPENSIIKRVEAKGGYVNFFFDYRRLAKDLLTTILEEDEGYGSSDIGKGEKVLVEYSAPNPNKPMHIGHMRNNFIGMSIGSILKFSGYKVILVNWINDRGAHICKSLWGYLQFGKKDGLKKIKNWKDLLDEWYEHPEKWLTPKDVNKKPDFFVMDYYVKAANLMEENKEYEEQNRELLKEWEIENPKVRALWKTMTEWAYEGWEETYKRQGCVFEKYYYESELYKRGKEIVLEHMEDGTFFKSKEGTIVANLEEYGLPGLVVLRSDGTSLYSTADLALTEQKVKDYPDARFVWIVGGAQKLYFQQLFTLCEILGIVEKKRCYHLGYGMVSLPAGKMSSRKGRVILADNLMDEVHMLVDKEVKKRNPKLSEQERYEVAERIALGAIKYAMLKIDAFKDLVFDVEEVIRFEGDTGPYLMYAHVRAEKILEKAGNWKREPSIENMTEEEKELIKMLMNFPDVVKSSAKDMKPNYICNYAHELAEVFSKFYHSCPVIHSEGKTRNFRLTLVDAFRITLRNCLSLLGMKAPKVM